MRPSIWALRPLERAAETRHFTDPERADWEGLTLTLRQMDGPRATRYAVLKADLMRVHVTGVRRADGTLETPPEPVCCQDFSRRIPDELVVDRYAKLAAMWDGEEPCPPLSEVIGWQALLYVGWLEIANWIEEVYTRGLLGIDQGNAMGPATEEEAAQLTPTPAGSIETSCEPASSTTTSTPNSPPDGTHSWPPSNGGSGSSPAVSAPVTFTAGTGRTAPWPD